MLIFSIPSVCENAEDKADEGDGRTDKSDSRISVSDVDRTHDSRTQGDGQIGRQTVKCHDFTPAAL